MEIKLFTSVIAFILIVLLSSSSADMGKFPFPFHKNKTTVGDWAFMDHLLKNFIGSYMTTKNIYKIYKFSRLFNVSSECKSSLMRFGLALRNTESWAVSMADATGKPPSGILEGTVLDFGSLEECVKVRATDSSGDVSFKGRYCMVGYKTPLLAPVNRKTPEGQKYLQTYGEPPEWVAEAIERSGGYLKRVSLWFGTCIPSTCSEVEIQRILSVISKPIGLQVITAGCQTDDPFVWPSYSFAAVCILCILIGLCLIGTSVEVLSSYFCKNFIFESESTVVKLVKSFSLLSNIEKWASSGTGSCGPLSCFHGIRFFSATWIVLGHTYFFTDTWKYLKYRHLRGVEEKFDSFLPLAVIENFSIPVGSFFFMSGFLLVYASWKKLENTRGQFNVVMFIVHKYWRMTPALGFMLILFLAMPIVNNGPIWMSTLEPPINACVTNWWTNLLYINNFWDQDQYCLIHTWYLAALMQFHIVGIVILLLLFNWPVVGSLLGLIIVLGSCLGTTLLSAWHNYPMPAVAIIKDMDVVDDYNSHVYSKPFTHIATYLIGMATAYIVLQYKGIRLSVAKQVLGWVLAVAGALLSVYGLYGPAENHFVSAFYIGFHRIGWAFGVAWMSYACITGNGGIVNRILSWRAFVPLGQLSYLVYLLHPLVILFKTASLRERVYYGHTELVFEYIAYTTISFFLAFLGYIFVEMPFTSLENIVFKKSPKVNTEVIKVLTTEHTKDSQQNSPA